MKHVKRERVGKAGRDQDVSHMCNFFFFVERPDSLIKPINPCQLRGSRIGQSMLHLPFWINSCLTWLAHPLGTFIPRITGSSRLPNLFNEFPATRTSISKCTNFPVYWDFRLQNQSRWSPIFIWCQYFFYTCKTFHSFSNRR